LGRSIPAIRATIFLLAIKQIWQGLTLTLFVFRVLADYSDGPFPFDDLTLVTNLLYRRPYFHGLSSPSRDEPLA